MPYTISYVEYSIDRLEKKLRELTVKQIGNNTCFIFMEKNGEKFVINTIIKYDKKGDKNIFYNISNEHGKKIDVGDFYEFSEQDIIKWCNVLKARKFAYIDRVNNIEKFPLH